MTADVLCSSRRYARWNSATNELVHASTSESLPFSALPAVFWRTWLNSWLTIRRVKKKSLSRSTLGPTTTADALPPGLFVKPASSARPFFEFRLSSYETVGFEESYWTRCAHWTASSLAQSAVLSTTVRPVSAEATSLTRSAAVVAFFTSSLHVAGAPLAFGPYDARWRSPLTAWFPAERWSPSTESDRLSPPARRSFRSGTAAPGSSAIRSTPMTPGRARRRKPCTPTIRCLPRQRLTEVV